MTPDLLQPTHGDRPDGSLLELIDRLLDRGVVVRGEIWLTVADVDLLFIGADLVIASPDRMQRDRRGALVPRTTQDA